MIDLFFKEAEKFKEKYVRDKITRPFLSQLIDGFKGIFGGSDASIENNNASTERREANLIASIPIVPTPDPEAAVSVPTSEFLRSLSEDQLRQEIQQAENPVAFQPIADAAFSEAKSESLKICGFATTQTPSHKDIIINEVAWMGSAESSANEWIEIKNISGASIDATGWQLIDMDEKLKVSLSGTILS